MGTTLRVRHGMARTSGVLLGLVCAGLLAWICASSAFAHGGAKASTASRTARSAEQASVRRSVRCRRRVRGRVVVRRCRVKRRVTCRTHRSHKAASRRKRCKKAKHKKPAATPAPPGGIVGGLPLPPGGSQPVTAWAPPGSKPLSDSAAASLVTRTSENRPNNVAANNYRPTDAELAAFHSYDSQAPEASSLRAYVTGRPGLSNPSTDDLIQWVAHKWGIPEDWIRAQMVVESKWGGTMGWNQSSMGDRTSVPSSWYSQYPAQARVGGTSDVYESMGLASVKWRADGSVNPGSEPLRWKSTAFNLDLYAADVRYFYDGDCIWCGSGYSAGQQWSSVGAWFSPYPWGNQQAQTYIGWVQAALGSRSWAQPGF
jgi:hypothetical protein